MDSSKKAYRIRVSTSSGNAYLVCVSYPLDTQSTSYGLDFFEIVWPSALADESIPSSRQATFKEELRAMHRAYQVCDASSESEEDFIAQCMRDVYGNDTTIQMSAIDQSLQTYEL